MTILHISVSLLGSRIYELCISYIKPLVKSDVCPQVMVIESAWFRVETTFLNMTKIWGHGIKMKGACQTTVASILISAAAGKWLNSY